MRGKEFEECIEIYGLSNQKGFVVRSEKMEEEVIRFGVMNVGAPSPGMNCAIRLVVKLARAKSMQIYAISNGFQGLEK